MSFGVGAGDILKVGELAYRVWKACSGASSEFKELHRELSSIQITLRSLADDAADPTSLMYRRGAARKDELMLKVGNLELALVEVERLVLKYQSLGLVKKRTFDRAKFATHDLGDIRQKLAVHLSALNSFYHSLSTSSLARIENVLEDLYQEIRNGDREPTVISMCNDPEDESAWNLLEKELASEGIEMVEVDRYRSDIVAFLRTLILKDPEGVEPSDSVSNDPSAHRLAVSDLLCLEKLRLHDLHLDHENPEEDDRESALRWAAEYGHLDLVQYLLRCEVDVNAHDQDGSTALHQSAKMGHLEVVRTLLDANADIEAMKIERSLLPVVLLSESARFWAGMRCKASVRKLTLSPLMEAARYGRTGVVQLLIERGARLDASQTNCTTPLHLAVENLHLSTSRTLIKAGAALEVASYNHGNRTPLFIAAMKGSPSLVKMLLKQGADASKTYKSEGTILGVVLTSEAKEESKLDICKMLVDGGVKVSPARIQDPKIAPLNVAIRRREDKIVDFLLSRGADPDFIDSSGKPPLYHAFNSFGSSEASLAIVKRLLKADADHTWRKDDDKCSYLHMAAAAGHAQVVEVLLDKGINVNDLDRFKTNALHFAANAGAVECVKTLLHRGINTTQQSQLKVNNYYARDLAILKGHAEVMALLHDKSPTANLKPQKDSKDKSEIWTYDRAREDYLESLTK